MRPAVPDFFVTGGNLRPDAPSYVVRQAGEALYTALQRGEFCYVLDASQMGKSSLMVHTAARLRADGVTVALFQLDDIGENLTVEQWYLGQLSRIGEALHLEDPLEDFWLACPPLGPLQRWTAALRPVQERLSVYSVARFDAAVAFERPEVRTTYAPLLAALVQVEEATHAGAPADTIGITHAVLNRRH